MDWQAVIDRQREALLRLVAVMFAAVGLDGDAPVSTVPRFVCLNVLGILRPAEAALRRLIVIKARGMIAPLVRPRSAPIKGIPRGKGRAVPAFPLFDPRKRFKMNGQRRYARGPGPRISSFDDHSWTAFEDRTVSPDDQVDAEPLVRRLQSVKSALDDIERQARRLVRAEVRRAARTKKRVVLRPMRPGRPPGHREKGQREVDQVLADCHTLALRALAVPDTS